MVATTCVRGLSVRKSDVPSASRADASIACTTSSQLLAQDQVSTQSAKAEIDLSRSPKRFLNRELSWLNFNQRVIEEAENRRHPLLERLRFLSISASNLDEFYSVRVAGLVGQVREGLLACSADGLSPKQQLALVRQNARLLFEAQQRIWRGLRQDLERAGIKLCGMNELSEREREAASHYFDEQIYPILTPLAIDPSHSTPFIPNLGIALALRLSDQNDAHHKLKALILLPQQINRFVRLPDFSERSVVQNTPIRFVLIENIIRHHIARLYPGMKIIEGGVIRIIRDSDVEFEDEAEDLVQAYETALKQRRRGVGIHLAFDAEISEQMCRELANELDVSPDDVITQSDLSGVADLAQMIVPDRADLLFQPFTPRVPETIKDYEGDCFAAIRGQDILAHHPFESFDAVVQFLKQAALDPQVVAIKQTLYRTSRDSPIVRALIQAAELGKSVTAMVELRARFDEEANIRLSRSLEAAGVQVVFGFAHLKTHAKMSLVIRREGGSLRSYAHFGTGNYHPITARIYTDLSYFTSDPKLAEASAKLFNYMTSYATPDKIDQLYFAPITLRAKLVRLIESEIENARVGRPAKIWLKMNNLVDPDLIDCLYRASHAGVKVVGIVRGMCCLRPGLPGLSQNIEIRSIVGRFLEHARIFVFGNGHRMPSRHAKVFISSADWMARNMDRRVETMVPITNPGVHAQILEQIMKMNIKDNTQAWKLGAEGSWKRVATGGKKFSAHDYFMQCASLPGLSGYPVENLWRREHHGMMGHFLPTPSEKRGYFAPLQTQ